MIENPVMDGTARERWNSWIEMEPLERDGTAGEGWNSWRGMEQLQKDGSAG